MNRDSAALKAVHVDWQHPCSLPAMSNEIDRHERYRLTSRGLQVDGSLTTPVSGELHFSRVPRERWDERLRLMRAAGLTMVSTYIFWNHHEAQPGRCRFDGNLDLAAFIRLAEEIGLGVILRVGPWCHGEARYGGLPDWVQHSGATLRTDDPAYLDLVDKWLGVLGAIAGPFCHSQGPVVSIQVENELLDQPGHIRTLKGMLRRAGLSAPVWTSSAWDGAELPGEEVLPSFGGYPDGFWMAHDDPWDDSFRSHFFFSHTWNDETAPSPVVTCELGGGMAPAYHRRPWPSPLDVAAIASNALGSGSCWQGYYMFAGGTNPAGVDGLQESHATGYPNDLPRFDYDFHAPIGATGRIAPSLGPLRRQHAFLAAFGAAGMSSSLPEVLPADLDDDSTLRWALRSDGSAGVVFIGWHQPELPLDVYRGARFEIGLENETIRFPAEPVDIPAGTVTRWPVNLDVGGVRLRWATASPLTVLDGGRPTLVLTADRGITPQLAFGNGEILGPEHGRELDNDAGFLVEATGIDVLVLDAEYADHVWVVERELYLSEVPLWTDGGLRVRAAEEPFVRRYEPSLRVFVAVECEGPPPRIGEVEARLERDPDLEYRSYGSRDGRASAPGDDDFLAGAAAWTLRLPDWFGRYGDLSELELEWTGDAAQLWLDGSPVADRFWDGSPWIVDLSALPVRADSELVLRVLPLFPHAPVRLPAAAGARMAAGSPLWSLDALRLTASTVWSECQA